MQNDGAAFRRMRQGKRNPGCRRHEKLSNDTPGRSRNPYHGPWDRQAMIQHVQTAARPQEAAMQDKPQKCAREYLM